MTFNDLDLHDQLQAGLRDIGYKEPTPIQEKSIPVILQKKDVIGAAQTGTGKTGAFVIPVLEQILQNPSEHTQALILSPTRELAQQIDEQIFALGYHTGLQSATIIGGEDFSQQAKAIRAGVDVIVATPGRLIDQTRVLDIDFSHIKFLVLDEADRMLDMGFMPDVTKIIDKLPKERQTLLFSATMPDQIKHLAKKIMKDPEKIEFEVSTPAESVEQQAYKVHPNQKLDLALHVLDEMEWDTCIIFSATKRGTDKLERLLNKKGINAGSIHGDRDQDERNKALQAFKNKTVPVIVATDVLARGIDIADVSLIINYDVPRAVDDYIHRIGRTGRYDKSGVAITFVTRNDGKYFSDIQSKVGDQLEIKELPKELGQKSSGSSSSKKGNDRKSRHESGSSHKESNKSDSSDNKNRKRRRRKPAPHPDQKDDNRQSSESDNKQQQKGQQDRSGKKDRKDQKDSRSRSKRSDSSASGNKKDTGSKRGSDKRDSGSSRRKKDEGKTQKDQPPVIPAERIKKATHINQNAPKPAKGIWGLIKSMVPRFRK